MRQAATIFALLALGGVSAFAQYLLKAGGPHVPKDDMAVLEAREEKKDLNCNVKPADPQLGFDFRFHAGYDVSLPLKDIPGESNELTMVFRVTPEGHPEARVYFEQKIPVPPIPENASGDSNLAGDFDLGEGKYQVDWLMHDRANRRCAHFWDAKAELNSHERDIPMDIAANTAEPVRREQFYTQAPVERASGSPLHVKVLVNFAPQVQDSVAMLPMDTVALVTMLRRIAQDPRVGRFSLVAFNIQEQRVLYRQSSADALDFPALGQAIHELKPGLVDAKLLANKRGEVEFLTSLIRDEIKGPDRPDAVIFAGPKYNVDGSPEDHLKAAESVNCPLFYLNYNTDQTNSPWRDAIGRAVRYLGGKEYSISRPRDLWSAVTEMVNHIVESRQGQTVPASR